MDLSTEDVDKLSAKERQETVWDLDSVLVYYDAVSPRHVMSASQLCKPYGSYDLRNGRCLCDEGFMPSRNPQYTGCAPYHSFGFREHPGRLGHKRVWETKDPKVGQGVGIVILLIGVFDSSWHPV